jgi:hypothetical protein
MLFSIVVVLNYIPSNSVWCSIYQISSSTFAVDCVLNGSHSDKSEIES